MIPVTDLHQFDVYNDGYFAHLPLTYVDGVILEIVVLRMPYEQLAEYLEEKCGKSYFDRFLHAIPTGGNLFEMSSGSEGFTVDEGKRTCSCKIMNFWPDQSMYSTVLPPKPKKMPGRPRKKRIKAICEGGSSTRVSKVGSQGSCSNCKKPKHTKSSCKEPVVKQTPKPKGVIGRLRKKQPVDDFEDVDVIHSSPIRDEGTSGTRGGAIGSREQTQAEPQQTQHEPEQIQVEDRVEQTEDQAEIDLTQLEQTQEPTQDQLHPQEQPQQAAMRMTSARILQRKLGKQGNSQKLP
nr:multidrug resistance-associated protein 5 [Tanacetum cinerariifolium]